MLAAIGVDDKTEDTGDRSEVVKKKRPRDLIEAFINISCSAGVRSIRSSVVLDAESGFPSRVVRTEALHPGIHAIELPGTDPGLEAVEAGGGPAAIQNGKDKGDPVGDGVFIL